MIKTPAHFRKIGTRLVITNRATPLRAGFTLIELLVVITILSVLAISVLPSLGTYRNNQNVTQMAESMITTARAAQAAAISGAKCGDSYNPQYKATNWGFYYNWTTYSYSPTCFDNNGNPVSSLPTYTYNNPPGISNVAMSTYDTSGIQHGCYPGDGVQFLNVSGQVIFYSVNNLCGDAQVSNLTKAEFTITGQNGYSLNVFIYRSGLISNY